MKRRALSVIFATAAMAFVAADAAAQSARWVTATGDRSCPQVCEGVRRHAVNTGAAGGYPENYVCAGFNIAPNEVSRGGMHSPYSAGQPGCTVPTGGGHQVVHQFACLCTRDNTRLPSPSR